MSTKTKQPLSRREALKVLGITTGAVVLSNLPGKWEIPVVEIGTLPAHAQASIAGAGAIGGGPIACGAQIVSGGDLPDIRNFELGRIQGTCRFDYNTYSKQDRIIIRYEGNTIFDTGCVGAAASQNVTYGPGNSTQIQVEVIPNCQTPPPGTAWVYTVFCP